MADLIYQPAEKSRAREYAELACNVYLSCSHGCSYCFAPKALHKSREAFDKPGPRPFFREKLDQEIRRKPGRGERVLLSFVCDPYQPMDEQYKDTRFAIETLHRGDYSVCVLTKGGTRALRDLDLFTPKDAFAATLTLLSQESSKEWEPNAALPNDRMEALYQFHKAGIPTWVSLEPVITPGSSLEIIGMTCDYVDGFKVGKLNYHPLAKQIDWGSFAHAAVELLEKLGYKNDPKAKRWYYVKNDLAAYL